MNWGAGDFNGDGKVDISDLTIVLTHYNQTSPERPPAGFGCRAQAGRAPCCWRALA